MSEARGVFVRSSFNYDRDEASDETGIACTAEESRTQQSFRDECDINVLVQRFGLSGELPTGVRMPTYGDYTEVSDFKSAMDAIAHANEAFDAMPANVRARFNNDPAAFVDFCSDVANRDEAVKLGLVLPQAAALASQPSVPGPALTDPPAIPSLAEQA